MAHRTAVTAGIYKGRRLSFPKDSSVRPTKQAVLQSSFDILGSRLSFKNLQVLDLFCGSGQWGVEALSRGAAHVTFVDTDVSHAQKNCAALEISSENTTFFRHAIHRKTSLPAVDIIIADPPYEEDFMPLLLANPQWGKEGSWWLLETRSDLTLEIPPPFTLEKHARYGQSALWLLRRS